MRDIIKDTRLCISLSACPTNIGTRFHNHLYGVRPTPEQVAEASRLSRV